eukprot:274401_1
MADRLSSRTYTLIDSQDNENSIAIVSGNNDEIPTHSRQTSLLSSRSNTFIGFSRRQSVVQRRHIKSTSLLNSKIDLQITMGSSDSDESETKLFETEEQSNNIDMIKYETTNMNFDLMKGESIEEKFMSEELNTYEVVNVEEDESDSDKNDIHVQNQAVVKKSCCYEEIWLAPIRITKCDEINGKLLLEWEYTDIDQGSKSKAEHQNQLEISEKTYNIQSVGATFSGFIKGDILCHIAKEEYKGDESVIQPTHDISEYKPDYIYKLIKDQDVPFVLIFKSKEFRCIKCMKKTCNGCVTKRCGQRCVKLCNKKCCQRNNSVKITFLNILIKWFIKFLTLTVGVISKITSILDM